MPVINNRQTLLDISVEHLGDAERLVEVILLNGFDIDDVTVGTVVVIPELDLNKKKVIDGFIKRLIHPASAIAPNDTLIGLDEWELFYTVGLPDSHG